MTIEDNFEKRAERLMIAEVRRRNHRRAAAYSAVSLLTLALAVISANSFRKSFFEEAPPADSIVETPSSPYLEIRSHANAISIAQGQSTRLEIFHTHTEVEVERIQAWELFAYLPNAQIRVSPDGDQTLLLEEWMTAPESLPSGN